MASCGWPARLNRRRISARVRRIRRCAGAGTGERWVSCGVFMVYVMSGRAGCPQALGPFFGLAGQYGQERMGEHGQGDMPVPGVVEADLVIAEAGLAFPCLEAFLDGTAGAGHADQLAEALAARIPAVVESKLAVIDGAADHVLAIGVSGLDERPVINAETFRADPAGPPLPGIRCQPRGQLTEDSCAPCGVGESGVLRDGHDVGDGIVLEVGAQAGILAEFLISGEPGERDACLERPPDQGRYLRRPGGELQVVRDARLGAAPRIPQP